jgi:hypothetical protein
MDHNKLVEMLDQVKKAVAAFIIVEKIEGGIPQGTNHPGGIIRARKTGYPYNTGKTWRIDRPSPITASHLPRTGATTTVCDLSEADSKTTVVPRMPPVDPHLLTTEWTGDAEPHSIS